MICLHTYILLSWPKFMLSLLRKQEKCWYILDEDVCSLVGTPTRLYILSDISKYFNWRSSNCYKVIAVIYME